VQQCYDSTELVSVMKIWLNTGWDGSWMLNQPTSKVYTRKRCNYP